MISTYVNCGAYLNGKRPETKKQLKQAIKDVNSGFARLLTFDQTSELTQTDLPPRISLDQIPDNVALSIVGPDPYRRRNWYATLINKNGKLVLT